MPVCRRAGLRGRGNANYRGGKMLKISAYITLIWLALAVCRYAAAKEEDACFADEHPALQTVIPCYNQQLATLPLSFSLKSVESGQHTEIRHYRLMSQSGRRKTRSGRRSGGTTWTFIFPTGHSPVKRCW